MKEGTCRPKREAAEIAKFRMRHAPGINWRGGSVKYSGTYLMYIIKHMLTVKLKSTVVRKIRKSNTSVGRKMDIFFQFDR